jgi:hypothetical protein
MSQQHDAELHFCECEIVHAIEVMESDASLSRLHTALGLVLENPYGTI